MSVFPPGHALTLTGLADADYQGYHVLQRALAEFADRHQERSARGRRPMAETAAELLEQVTQQQPVARTQRGRALLLGALADGGNADWTPVDDAAAGLAPVLRIVGPPRSGKTTLAAKVAAQAGNSFLAGDDPSLYLAASATVQRLTAQQLLEGPPRDCELLIVDSKRPAVQRWGSRMAREARTSGIAVVLVDIPRDTHGVTSEGVCASLLLPGLGTVRVPHAPSASFRPLSH